MKKLIGVILSVLMAATLFGCGGKEEFDPEKYVMGVLDTAYHCDVDGYVKQTDVKKNEAEEAHVEFAKNSGLRLAAYFGIEPSEDMVIEYQDICERLYQNTEYEVTDVIETEDGYEVVVEFAQEKFIQNVEKSIVHAQNRYQKSLAEGNEDAQEKYEEELLEAMDGYIKNKDLQMNAATLVLVENEDGSHAITPDSLNAFHEKMFGF